MARTADHSRDLLFGLLALQNGLIDQAQLVVAFQGWARDKARPLSDYLVAPGYLDPAHRPLLEGLAEAHIARHGGSPERSLAAISAARSTCESLARLGDPDIDATLARVGSDPDSTRDGQSDLTASYAVGSATSEGQRFRILRPHARGGLGAVFVAIDNELHREVALKQLLDQHADDLGSRQRFLIEAEITGGLEHPGVVPVYGLGTYGGGRPYYAMRFIKGDSLKEAIAQFHADRSPRDEPGRWSLELRKLLRRFLDVCNAIEYAHSRGVLHRDIKPGNIIVGKYGETLVVDWGLAKATGRAEPGGGEGTFIVDSADGSSETLPGSVLGTPAYMSPEQAVGDHDQIGVRSDVYCLGATLYSLLTGNPAFEGDDIGVLLCDVRRGRFTPPRMVDPSIDRALEATCLKAMALQPQDRYRSSKALADDIERWMADEPVSSYREPRAARARRWMRRHRTAVVSSVWLLFASVIGLSVGLILLRAKQRETEVARAEAVESYLNAVRARQAADSARQEAEANFARAMDAVETMLVRVGQRHLANLPHFELVRRRLLEDALGFYRDFLARPGTSPAAVLQGARAYRFAGDIHRKLGQRDRARQELGKSLELLGRIPDGPGRSLEQAAVHRVVGALDFDERRTPRAIDEYRRGLARLATYRGATIEPRIRRAFLSLEADTESALASLLASEFRFDESRASLRQARLVLGRLIADDPDDEDHRYQLSAVEHHDGLLHLRRDELGAAVERWREAIRILDGLLESSPDMVHYRRDLGNSTMLRGSALAVVGRSAEAVEVGRRAVAIYDRLAADYPNVWEYRFQAAAAHHNLADSFSLRGDIASAEGEYRGSIDELGILSRREPENPLYIRDLANSHMNLGSLLAGVRRFDDSSREMSRARDLFARAVRSRPDDPDIRFQAAAAEHNRAETLMAAGRLDEAIEGFHESQVRLEELILRSPGSPRHLKDLANSTSSKGYCLLARGERARADAELTRALKLWDDLLARSAPGNEYRAQRGRTLVLLGRYDDAVRAAEVPAIQPNDGGKVAYDAACVLAFNLPLPGRDPLAAARIPAERAGGFADRAMGLLALALGQGYGTRELINGDRELDALRDRADFRKLHDLLLDRDFPADPFAR